MKSKFNVFLQGAGLLLTYHLYILALIGSSFLLPNWKLFRPFQFLGHTASLAFGFVLLLFATPIIYFFIRRCSKATVRRILTAHVLISILVSFFVEYELVSGLYLFAPYLAIIPLYLILYRKQPALFAWGALCVHIVLTLLCFLIGQNVSHAISEWMIVHNGDNGTILVLFGELIIRSFIGLITPIVHLIICLIRVLFPSNKAAEY